MSPSSPPPAPRKQPDSRPSVSRSRGSEKDVSQPKHEPKRRSLNEAAHKLDR
jgi:hypothetical protein